MDNQIGTRIQQRRKALHITQTTISEKTGISTGNLSGIEKGRSLPSASALIGLSQVLHCSIDWILTGTSSISEFSPIVDLFNQLSTENQEEILDIIKLKLKRQQRESNIIAFTNKPIVENDSPQIPVLGYVAAGIPILSYENLLTSVSAYNRLISYALYAKGHSMEPVILDNELIGVSQQKTLENGEIGIIRIGDEVTCKKFYKYPDRIELVSFNKDFEPIQIFKNDSKDVQILGKVVLNDVQKDRL